MANAYFVCQWINSNGGFACSQPLLTTINCRICHTRVTSVVG
jgi:hypothetical protein